MEKVPTMFATLRDKSANDKELQVKVENGHTSVYLCPQGYGDGCSEDGFGCPVMLEIWEGELRLVVWGDINQQDPTHIISLEGAAENKRE